MIAATALARGATVVTGNVEDVRPTGVTLGTRSSERVG